MTAYLLPPARFPLRRIGLACKSSQVPVAM